MKHCCVSLHYSFQIKKCGSESCSVCGPIRLPKPVFDQLHFLPDPVPGEDGHYKGFKDLLGTKTDGTHRPSLQKASKRTKLFPSAQVFNTSRTLTSCFNVMNAASGGYSIANSSLLGKSVLISRQACKMFLLHVVLNCKT